MSVRIYYFRFKFATTVEFVSFSCPHCFFVSPSLANQVVFSVMQVVDDEGEEVAETGHDEAVQLDIVPMLQNVTDECQVFLPPSCINAFTVSAMV